MLFVEELDQFANTQCFYYPKAFEDGLEYHKDTMWNKHKEIKGKVAIEIAISYELTWNIDELTRLIQWQEIEIQDEIYSKNKLNADHGSQLKNCQRLSYLMGGEWIEEAKVSKCHNLDCPKTPVKV